ncbi:DUF6061 family protein [Flavonifractor plautii]
MEYVNLILNGEPDRYLKVITNHKYFNT